MHGQNTTLARRYFPEYRRPKRVYQDLLDAVVKPDTVWLDLGCGRRVCADSELNRALPRRAALAVGADANPDLPHHEGITNLVRCDGAALPFRDGTFTLLTAAMLVEHLDEPRAVFAEAARVCRPGARFIVFTPNRFNYAMIVSAVTPHRFHIFYRRLTHYLARREWRDFDPDVFPTRYRANTVRRLRRCLSEAGFVQERLELLSLVQSFGFVRPLYVASLVFERLVNRLRLDVLKADILGVFVRTERGDSSPEAA